MIETLNDWLSVQLQNPYWRAALVVGLTLVVVGFVRLIVVPILRRMTQRTGAGIDDAILEMLWPAVVKSIFIMGAQWVVVGFFDGPTFERLISGTLTTLLVLLWGRALVAVGNLVCTKLSENHERFDWIQPQSLPLIQFAFKVVAFGLMSYLIMSAWHINLTSWLASAGVAGIAVGFAAKDTLANFISGIFILADAPYRVGQYIIIDGVTRGEVTEIGMRSTRLLTRDNVEVTVPNAVIGNAKIVNESSGPSPRMRLRVNVGVAYGSDVAQVRSILEGCTRDLKYMSRDQAPAVRFTALGASSLDFQVLVWIEHPAVRGRVIDDLNTRIYEALNAAGVSIPFPQQDLHIKSWPELPGGVSENWES